MEINTQNRTISEMAKKLLPKNSVCLDLVKLARKLHISISSNGFGDQTINGEKIVCVFVTDEQERSGIFYNADLLKEEEFTAAREIITLVFAKHIITGKDNFYITKNTLFSKRVKSLAYSLLMPEIQVESVLDQLVLPTTLRLAQIFKVSQQFVNERLRDMNVTCPIGGYNY